MANHRSPAAKAAALGVMYGMRGGGKSTALAMAAAQQNVQRHPLMLRTEYHWKGIDNRFGVHRYKCSNSTLCPSINGDELGTTGVRHSLCKIAAAGLSHVETICVLGWVRRHGTERMKEAVACALMLGHETVVIAHAFGEE